MMRIGSLLTQQMMTTTMPGSREGKDHLIKILALSCMHINSYAYCIAGYFRGVPIYEYIYYSDIYNVSYSPEGWLL